MSRSSAWNGWRRISIHAPRTGSDNYESTWRLEDELFQSTLPARGATGSRQEGNRWRLFQSTLPARGATAVSATMSRLREFQSTLPARGATGDLLMADADVEEISIHAPRTGSDSTPLTGQLCP